MFDYPFLEILSAVDRERNFERAALRLGISKSYVSQCLRLLEERMGGIVVRRDTIDTTSFGKGLCRHLENLSLLEHRFLSDNDHLFKIEPLQPVTIKVAMDCDSLSSWIKSILATLSSKRNHYFLDIEICDPARSKEEMNVGRIHCALSTSPQPLPGFDCHRLGTLVYRATASPSFLEKHFSDGITTRSLSKSPVMLGLEDEAHMRLWLKMAIGQDVEPPSNLVTSAHGILNACLNGKCWAMNSSLLADEYIETGELVELVPGVSVQNHLYWHINSCVSETLKDLTNAIVGAGQCLATVHPPFEPGAGHEGLQFVDLAEPIVE